MSVCRIRKRERERGRFFNDPHFGSMPLACVEGWRAIFQTHWSSSSFSNAHTLLALSFLYLVLSSHLSLSLSLTAAPSSLFLKLPLSIESCFLAFVDREKPPSVCLYPSRENERMATSSSGSRTRRGRPPTKESTTKPTDESMSVCVCVRPNCRGIKGRARKKKRLPNLKY